MSSKIGKTSKPIMPAGYIDSKIKLPIVCPPELKRLVATKTITINKAPHKKSRM